ncbi:MAG: response regulator transcription factor [Alicyclobacillus macrosporangiidus]|uniref:response regulator n=1 Tax=Alicyclobacillus macrosporangiidus TaxID=392015 RepID=UPI0026F15BD5|nr:response regulator transcription factor [Alicyclobacillus macrosporangiidus]MCL6599973.1 response regulator transcription factor [Alicyclobacillus macrosporangiidus]
MIRVMIVDDQRLMRDGLRTLLQMEPDIQVVGEAGDGEEAVRLAQQQEVDVVLLDIRMPRCDGISALRQLRRLRSNLRVLMLTTYDDRTDIVDALRSGANGYLVKDMRAEEIAEAIRTVMEGGAVLPPRVASEFLAAVHTEGMHAETAGPGTGGGATVPPLPGEEALTDREREVLHRLAQGLSNREIARELFVSEGTVKNHVSSVIAKLGLRDRTQAAVYAVRRGFGVSGSRVDP